MTEKQPDEGGMTHRILLVGNDEEQSRIADLLLEVGYEVTRAHNFREAIQRLTSRPRGLLISDARVGTESGLGLMVRAQIDNLCLATIIVGSASDPSLEREAKQLGAAGYLHKPIDANQLLAAVVRALSSADRRHASRKRLRRGLSAVVGGQSGTVVDVSANGLRLQMPVPLKTQLPVSIHVMLLTLGLSLEGRTVWTSGAAPSTFLCGAALLELDEPTARSWREFVEALPA